MKKFVYCVLDEKAQTIMPLFLGVSDDEAKRAIVVAVKSDMLVSRYPADFALLRIGQVDTSNGKSTPNLDPVLVCKLDELLEAK